jgi:outer membrane protein assembly factor BamB
MPLQRREFLATGIVALSGCTALGRSKNNINGPSRWETYGRGPKHPSSYADGSIPSKKPSVDQSFELTGSRTTSPVGNEDYLAVGDEQGVFVVPFADQEYPNRVEPPGTVAGTPCLDGDTVYVTSYEMFDETDTAYVSAMTVDGETTWQTDLSADMVTMATIRNGTVFARSDEAYFALDADSGEIQWRTPKAGPLKEGYLSFENFGPAAGNDVVVFPDLQGVTAIDPADGSISWQHELQKVRACPTIADGTVYVADVHSGVHAFDATTGDRKWHWPHDGCWAPPVVSGEHVYTTDPDDVVALERESGELDWRTNEHGLHGGAQSGISVVGDTVLASSGASVLLNVQRKSGGLFDDPGTVRWMLDGSGLNTPIAVGDRIAFVAHEGNTPMLRVIQ